MFGRKKEYSDPSVKDYFDRLEESSGSDSESFVSSLDTVKASELAPENADVGKKKKRRTGLFGSNTVSLVLFIIFGCIFVYCCWQIAKTVVQYISSDDFYEGIADDFAEALGEADKVSVSDLGRVDSSDPMQSFSEIRTSGARIYDPSLVRPAARYSARFLSVLVQIDSYRSKNPDVYGFINIDSTKIRYIPLVQTDNNDFYLNHDVDGNSRNSGALFVDFRNSRELENNRNIVTYGHNMENGGMFHGLLNYLNESFFSEKDIVIYTSDGIYTFTVFSIYPTYSDSDYFRTFFYSDNDFLEFCRREEENSIFHKSGISFESDSIILTLSTCITGLENGRYAIHALLTRVEH